MAPGATYEGDFYAWTQDQAALLREGRLAEADLGNIAGEVEGMGKSVRHELDNWLIVLLVHLLKWSVQPERQGRSWTLTIREQRLRIVDHLDENPSLRPKLEASVRRGFRLALLAAQRETDLADTAFPPVCPWTIEQVLDAAFLPE